jgi:hypothetical protein
LEGLNITHLRGLDVRRSGIVDSLAEPSEKPFKRLRFVVNDLLVQTQLVANTID